MCLWRLFWIWPKIPDKNPLLNIHEDTKSNSRDVKMAKWIWGPFYIKQPDSLLVLSASSFTTCLSFKHHMFLCPLIDNNAWLLSRQMHEKCHNSGACPLETEVSPANLGMADLAGYESSQSSPFTFIRDQINSKPEFNHALIPPIMSSLSSQLLKCTFLGG